VTFIGPPAEPMMALGDKIGSTIIAQSAGVPTISWNGDSLRVNYKEEGIPQSVYDQANVESAEACLECCNRIGYPVMIKASEGGGGKGIRKVLRSEDVLNSFKAVQGEIPGSPIFVMKMASHARHLEVQLLADKHGEAIALSGRDCSVQRRHQKIIEEGPPIAAPVSVFKRMEQAAVALAKTVGYISAGTVEYLFIEETQEYAFLELNPRLQVEHPVTENILGINLPACQLQVAMGLHLYSIGDIRRLYGRHTHGKDTIDFTYAERVVSPRHCIAVRVTAENPDAGFQPTSGNIQELQFKSSVDVWGYFSVDHTGLIHEFADSQFGHIFASGRDRESARRAMLAALKELQIRGEIRTTIEYIVKIMQTDDFIANRIDTMWLDERLQRHTELCLHEYKKYELPITLVATVGAALKGYQHFQQCNQDFIQMLGHGHVPSKEILSSSIAIDLIYQNIKFQTKVILTGPNSVMIQSNANTSTASEQLISIRQLPDHGYLLDISGKSHLVYSMISATADTMRIILDGQTCIFTPEYDPTKLFSTVAGKLARFLVPDKSHVTAGDLFVEIEVMKMYMPLKVSEAGIIEYQISEGATLMVGDVIATVQLDHPETVIKAEVFKGTLNAFAEELSTEVVDPSSMKSHQVHRQAKQQLQYVFDGYFLSGAQIQEYFSALIDSFHDPLLAVYELEDLLSVLRGRIDHDLFQYVKNTLQSYSLQIESSTSIDFPAGEILSLLSSHGNSLSSTPDKQVAYQQLVSSLWMKTEEYYYAYEVRALSFFMKMIEQYLSVERWFDLMSFSDVVNEFRKGGTSKPDQILQLCRSHVNIRAKNQLLFLIFEEMKSFRLSTVIKLSSKMIPSQFKNIPMKNQEFITNFRSFKSKLTALSQLRQKMYIHVSFNANLLLLEQSLTTYESRKTKLEEVIHQILECSINQESDNSSQRLLCMKRFLDMNIIIRDVLLDFLSVQHDLAEQLAVMEIYIRKIYNKTHTIKSMETGTIVSPGVGSQSAPYLRFTFITKSFDGISGENSPQSSNSPEPKKNVSFTDLTTLSRSSTGTGALQSLDSIDNLHHPIVPGLRIGLFIKLDNLANLDEKLKNIAELMGIDMKSWSDKELVNGIHIIVQDGWDDKVTDDEGAALLSRHITPYLDLFKSRGIRRVTFFIGIRSSSANASEMIPKTAIFTFRARLGYIEDRLYRNIEAPHAFHLELPRLSNFTITSEDDIHNSSGNNHLYRALPKGNPTGPVRYFVRVISFQEDIQPNDVESLFLSALDQLSFATGKEEATNKNYKSNSASNHVFINIANPDTIIHPEKFEADLETIWDKNWYKLVRLSVTMVELKVSCRLANDGESISLRFVATNPTGYVITTHIYYDTANLNGQTVFRAVSNRPEDAGPWDGMAVTTPYPLSHPLEKKRTEAMNASDTLYVYDWPILFESACAKLMKSHDSLSLITEKCVFFEELVLQSSVPGKKLSSSVKGKFPQGSPSAELPLTCSL
jgi:acetyl-CoA carboxylase / biotin carboxylase 1